MSLLFYSRGILKKVAAVIPYPDQGTSLTVPPTSSGGADFNVSNSSELTTALGSAEAGDIIELADGTYTASSSWNGINGSSGNPIVIRAANSRQAVFTGLSSSRLMRMENCSFLQFEGIKFDGNTNDPVWGIVLGDAFNNEGRAGSNDITFLDCEVTYTTQTLVKFASNSFNIIFANGTIHASGVNNTGAFAEGFYLGNGSTAGQVANAETVHDVLIEGNTIHTIGQDDCGGEAVDIKNMSYNITVRNNDISDNVIASQGAITVLYDSMDGDWSAPSPNILVENNTIDNVMFRSGSPNNADGMWCGKNDVVFYNNVMTNIAGNEIVLRTNAAQNTTGDVILDSNSPNTYTDNGSGGELNIVQI